MSGCFEQKVYHGFLPNMRIDRRVDARYKMSVFCLPTGMEMMTDSKLTSIQLFRGAAMTKTILSSIGARIEMGTFLPRGSNPG